MLWKHFLYRKNSHMALRYSTISLSPPPAAVLSAMHERATDANNLKKINVTIRFFYSGTPSSDRKMSYVGLLTVSNIIGLKTYRLKTHGRTSATQEVGEPEIYRGTHTALPRASVDSATHLETKPRKRHYPFYDVILPLRTNPNPGCKFNNYNI